MKEYLRRIRAPKGGSTANKALYSLLIVLLGIGMGFGAKLLDLVPAGEGSVLESIAAKLDLGNLFSAMPVWLLIGLAVAVFSSSAPRAALNTFLFFIGLCAAYHAATVLFARFDPSSYMKIWYLASVISAALGFFAWYARGSGLIAAALSLAVLGVMAAFCFPAGFWYFDITVFGCVFFIAAAAILHRSFKRSAITFFSGLALGFLLRAILPFGF